MNIPRTDSIGELAAFWDSHDVTEFSDELEEVSEPVFARGPLRGVTVPLTPEEMKALRDIASAQGVDQTALVRAWVREKLRTAH
jgi:hypothetical protein